MFNAAHSARVFLALQSAMRVGWWCTGGATAEQLISLHRSKHTYTQGFRC